MKEDRQEIVNVAAPTPPTWTVDSDGSIHFSLTSTGETGTEWADWFRTNRYDLDNDAKFMLRSTDFQPNKVDTISEIVVLPCKLWSADFCITPEVRVKAGGMGFKQEKEESPEIACLIRRAFSDEEIEKKMGLTRIITLHTPICGSDGDPSLLAIYRGNGGGGLGASCDWPDSRWDRDDSFAFVVSQVSPQN